MGSKEFFLGRAWIAVCILAVCILIPAWSYSATKIPDLRTAEEVVFRNLLVTYPMLICFGFICRIRCFENRGKELLLLYHEGITRIQIWYVAVFNIITVFPLVILYKKVMAEELIVVLMMLSITILYIELFTLIYFASSSVLISGSFIVMTHIIFCYNPGEFVPFDFFGSSVSSDAEYPMFMLRNYLIDIALHIVNISLEKKRVMYRGL